MLDWFSGRVGYDASKLKTGSIISVSPEGEIEYSRDRWLKVKGSFESSVQLRRGTYNREMLVDSERRGLVCSPICFEISGNPVKFLQGHNVFGPSVRMLEPIVRCFFRSLPIVHRPEGCEADVWPALYSSRIDITEMIEFESHQDVHDWIVVAGSMTRSRHGKAKTEGRELTAARTVYWGLGSRRWNLKAYCKCCELARHPVADLKLNDELRSWCENQIRIELCLRRPELKDIEQLDETLIFDYLSRIQVGVSNMTQNDRESKLVAGAELCLRRWRDGVDVKVVYPRRTFYHYRRLILDEVGIDISLEVKDQKEAMKTAIKRDRFEVGFLKSRVVSEIPVRFQGLLLKPS